MGAVRAEHLHGAAKGRGLNAALCEVPRDAEDVRPARVNRQERALPPDADSGRGTEVRPAADQDSIGIKHRARLDETGKQSGYRMSACRRDRVVEKLADLRDGGRAGNIYGNNAGAYVGNRL